VQNQLAYQALYDNSSVDSWDSQGERVDWDKVIAYIRNTVPEGARILDFGCYTGGLLTRLGPKYQRFGIEVNARAACVAEAAGIRVWPAIENIPGESRFDVVVACDVIEHMPDPEAFALALVSRLSADGQVIITTGDAENRLWERFGPNWWYCFYPEHIAFISQRWLSNLCLKHNLRVGRCEQFFHLRSRWPKRLAVLFVTAWYGLFPRSYLAAIRQLSYWRGVSEPRSVPGNGASADHLFISLSRGGIAGTSSSPPVRRHDMSMRSMAQGFQRALRRAGIDLRRYNPAFSESARLASMLAANGVDLVFDVGANTGQFALELRDAGYRGRLVSFEPLSSAHSVLQRASRHDPRWTVAPRGAVGAHDGEIDINIAGNSVSSSVLGMLEQHTAAAPSSAYVGSERVSMRRLDSLAGQFLSDSGASFLKIDTQGYESQVLDGAQDLLGRVKGLHLELSLVPLYEGQALYPDLVERLENSGFSLWAVWSGICDPRNGRMLQVDATFFRG
jgi:FkbM family methyltransferase